jgi:hypothetical protein
MHVISAISAGSVVRANFQSTPRRNAATRPRGARFATRASSGEEQSDGSILFTFGKDPLGALFPKREPREGLFDAPNPAANAFKNEVTEAEEYALKRQYGGGGGILDKLLPKREPHDGLAGPKLTEDDAEEVAAPEPAAAAVATEKKPQEGGELVKAVAAAAARGTSVKDAFAALFPKREPREGLFDKPNPAANAFKNEVDDREDAALKRQYGGGIMEKLLPKREPHDGLAGPKK